MSLNDPDQEFRAVRRIQEDSPVRRRGRAPRTRENSPARNRSRRAPRSASNSPEPQRRRSRSRQRGAPGHRQRRRQSGSPEGRLRLHPVHEDGQIQERTILITSKGVWQQFKYGGLNDEKHGERECYRRIQFRTANEYKRKIDHAVKSFHVEVDKVDDYWTTTIVSYLVEDSFGGEDIAANGVEEHEIGVQRTDTVIDNRYLKKADTNRMTAVEKLMYLNCLLKQFITQYVDKIPTLAPERGGIERCCKIMDMTKEEVFRDGVPIKKFKLLCDSFKISMLALTHARRLVIPRTVYNSSPYKFFCCYVFDGHCYPILDQAERTHISHVYQDTTETTSRAIKQDETKEVQQERKAVSKRFKQEKELMANVPLDQLDGLKDCNVYYNEPNLKPLLAKLLEEKKTLFMHHHNKDQITSITYDNGVKLLANPNHRSKMDWTHSKYACKIAGVEFRNQSLSAVGWDHMTQMHHPAGAAVARVPPTNAMRAQIIKEQNSKCNMCQKPLRTGDNEINHIIPCSQGGRTVRSNLEALCVECHKEVTIRQATERLVSIDNSLSYYNDQTIEIFSQIRNGICHNFFDSEDPKFRTWKYMGFDLTKCRRHAVRYQNKEDWCVFSCLDAPQRFDADKHGVIPRGCYFIESDNIGPLHGNGWYTATMVKHCLKHHVIGLNQIKCVVIASLRLEPQYFNRWIDDLVSRFSGKHTNDQFDNQAILKLMINGVFGMFGSRTNVQRHLRYFLQEKAANADYKKRKPEKDTVFTVIPKSFKPLDECTCANECPRDCTRCKYNRENVDDDDFVYDLHNFCKRCYANETRYKADEDGIYRHKDTDYYEVTWHTEKLKMESHMPIFMQILDLEAIEVHKMMMRIEQAGGKPCHINTDCVIGMFPDSKSAQECWAEASKVEWAPGVPKYKLDCSINPSKADRVMKPDTNTFDLKLPRWRVFDDPGHDNFEKLARQCLDQIQGFNLLGYAGCGKTHLLHCIQAELRRRETPFLSVAPTHQAKKILDAEARTILSAFSGLKNGGGFHRFKHYAYIIVDECSMISEPVWLVLIRTKQKLEEMGVQIRFIVAGDFTQLPPIEDRVGKNFNYKDSYGLHWLCDGTRVCLSHNRRGKIWVNGELVPSPTSAKLFNLYMNPDMVDPAKFGKKDCELSLCYTNRKRIAVNKYWMELRSEQAGVDRVLVPKPKTGHKHYQDLWIYVGLPLIARKTRSTYSICNADRLQVVKYNSKTVYLRHQLGDGELGEEVIEIPLKDITSLCQPGFCLTLHCAQGASLDKYTIYQWDRMDHCMKYVALSRARRLEGINIAECDPDDIGDDDAVTLLIGEEDGNDETDWSEFYSEDAEPHEQEEAADLQFRWEMADNAQFFDPNLPKSSHTVGNWKKAAKASTEAATSGSVPGGVRVRKAEDQWSSMYAQ